MMRRLPFGAGFVGVVGLESVTHHVGELVQLALHPVTLAVGVGPQLGSR
jgi:N-acetylglutamate synthase-like GNAT family acetyltransferase